MKRETQQRLAIALGMTLKDGSQIQVDGGKCPSVTKMLDFMRDHYGASFARFSRAQREDNLDDFGGRARHDAAWGTVPPAAAAILDEPCGYDCITGDRVRDELLTYL
ncbi:MAG: hypothetical protein ABIH03_05730 [Pseudomonadota bacterium]